MKKKNKGNIQTKKIKEKNGSFKKSKIKQEKGNEDPNNINNIIGKLIIILTYLFKVILKKKNN
jgi:hypothetical protein